MGRSTSSSSGTVLGGISIVVLVALLTSIIGGSDLQWIFIIPFILVLLWAADAISGGR